MTQPSAEQVLAGFYRRCGAPGPAFDFGTGQDEERRPVHTATCTLADATWEGQPVPGDRHTASAGRRKAAQRAAAEAALDTLKDHPAFEADQDAMPERVHESPLATLVTMLSDVEVRRSAEVEAAVLLAQRHAGGWLPLPALLAPARRTLLAQWGRRYLPHLLHDQAGLVTSLRARLAAEPPLPDAGLEFDGDYTVVRRSEAYIPAGGSNAAAALQASLDAAARRQFPAVLLPADTRLPPREVALNGSGYYLEEIAAALGCEPQRVWHWGIANRNFRVLAPPEAATAVEAGGCGGGGGGNGAGAGWSGRGCGGDDAVDEPDDLEAEKPPLVGLARGLLSPEPITAEDVAAAAAAKPDEALPPSEGAGDWPSGASLHPSMYSALPEAGGAQAPWNPRAGWITGKAVRGDVLLARVRPRPWVVKLEGRQRAHPLLRAGGYPLAEVAAAAAACAPAALHARHLHAPLAAHLPADLRIVLDTLRSHHTVSCDAWCGRPPKALLLEVGTPGVCGPGATPAFGLPHAEALVPATPDAACGEKRRSADGPTWAHGPPPKAAACAPADAEAANADTAPQRVAAAAPDAFVSQATVPLLGGDNGDAITAVSDTLDDAEAAENQAALRALHMLQGRHTAAWAAAFPEGSSAGGASMIAATADVPLAAADGATPPAAAGGAAAAAGRHPVEVVEAGRGLHRPILPGMRVKVAYIISVASAAGLQGGALPKPLVLEHHHSLAFEWATGSVLPEVEAAAAAVALHGVARCGVGIRLPAAPGPLPAVLSLRLLDVTPPGPGPQPGALFSPPAAAQRYALVASLALAAGGKTLVDLGCGDGKLIQHLASDDAAAAEALQSITGIDISATAVVRGRKTLELDQQLAVAAGAPRPAVDLVLADMCKTGPGDWGRLRGVDAAAMVEVVEHLDPAPLAAAGPALLGGLQPQVAIVSTPNFEYNPVLAAAGGGPLLLHNGLRNRDHRFEWTRAEFRDWAAPLAAAHGYQVHFTSIGRIRPEVLKGAPAAAAVVAAEPSPGCATQVALFVRRAPGATD